MIKCAITGHTGVLGSRLVKNLPFSFYLFKGDITKFKQVDKWVNKENFDAIIHLAALVPTKYVEKNYKKAYQVNYIGTKNLIKSIKKKKIKPKWFFFSSTSHIYNLSNKSKTISETNKSKPSSLYGLTKLLAEKELIKKFKKENIILCIGRIFSFTDKNQKKPFVIPEITDKILKSKTNVVKLKNLNHFRDFISSKDIIKIIYKLYLHKKDGIFNIGSGKKINLKDIALSIGKKLNKKIIFTKDNKTTFLVSNNKKIRKFYSKKLINPIREILDNI